MITDQWASLDQYTSFAKSPWGSNRPENRNEHSVLSKATFAEWPNTTCDFSIHNGVAPPGKLARPKPKATGRSDQSDQPMVSSSSLNSSSIITTRTPGSRNNERAMVTIDGKLANPLGTSTTGVPPGKARHSADDVTAAFTLMSARQAGKRGVQSSPRKQATPQHGRESTDTTSPWSVNNIGFNDGIGGSRARAERENREGYVRAAFAAQAADKPYVAEAARFRVRYPHTLGRITALSHTRSDRIVTTQKQSYGK